MAKYACDRSCARDTIMIPFKIWLKRHFPIFASLCACMFACFPVCPIIPLYKCIFRHRGNFMEQVSVSVWSQSPVRMLLRVMVMNFQLRGSSSRRPDRSQWVTDNCLHCNALVCSVRVTSVSPLVNLCPSISQSVPSFHLYLGTEHYKTIWNIQGRNIT